MNTTQRAYDAEKQAERCPTCGGSGRLEMLEHCPDCRQPSNQDASPTPPVAQLNDAGLTKAQKIVDGHRQRRSAKEN